LLNNESYKHGDSENTFEVIYAKFNVVKLELTKIMHKKWIIKLNNF